MGWRDRPYADDSDGGFAPMGGGMSFALPKPTRVVTYLLVINIAIFVLMAMFGSLRGLLFDYFSMTVTTKAGGVLAGQIWRLVTYQYLHSTSSAFHLFFNMLGLYFLGPPLERRWGGKTFFAFYTACGVAGALLFCLFAVIGFLPLGGAMIGASGSVLGLLAACAVLMPEMVIILLFFPVPIRLAALLLVAVYLLNLLTAFASGYAGAGGDAAHLGGMAFGAVWSLWGWSWLRRRREEHHRGAWERKLKRERELELEVDRILSKVHEDGIQSLTRREKQILAEATEAQREREQRARFR